MADIHLRRSRTYVGSAQGTDASIQHWPAYRVPAQSSCKSQVNLPEDESHDDHPTLSLITMTHGIAVL